MHVVKMSSNQEVPAEFRGTSEGARKAAITRRARHGMASNSVKAIKSGKLTPQMQKAVEKYGIYGLQGRLSKAQNKLMAHSDPVRHGWNRDDLRASGGHPDSARAGASNRSPKVFKAWAKTQKVKNKLDYARRAAHQKASRAAIKKFKQTGSWT